MTIHDSYYTKEFQAVAAFYKEAEAPSQVDFLENSIPLKRQDDILDLACGYGGHAIILAQRGYTVTGYDQSSDYIQQARRSAADAAVEVTFELVDMRKLDVVEQFDCVLSMSSALAFYADNINVDILGRIYRSLRPGGRFFFDQANIFWLCDWCGKNKHKGKKELPDGRIYHYETTFDPATCILSRRSVLEDEDTRKESGWDLRYYTLPELKMIMQEIGFCLSTSYGDYDSSPYSIDAMHLITIWNKL